MHGAAIAMITVAWFAGHLSVLGWLTLIVGVALEIQARRPPRVRLPARPAFVPPKNISPEIPPAAPKPVQRIIDEPPQPQPNNVPAYVTYALLKVAHDITGDVLTASLRRAGRRDATLSGRKSDGSWQIQFGSLFLELSKSARLPKQTLEYAAAQTFDWPEALEVCVEHASAVRLATPLHASASRRDLVRLHHEAHAALTEFTQVMAIYWEGPGRLSPESAIKSLSVERGDRPELYINFRSFPSENHTSVVCDSVGLHAFGLPDVQIVTPGDPDESISALLFDTASGFFRDGCTLTQGQVIPLSSGQRFHAEFTQSRQPPDREVVELAAESTDADGLSAEKLGHDPIGDKQSAAGEPEPLGDEFEQTQG
jgi:hypothetical protein